MTELTDFQQKISALLPDLDLRFHEPMSKHTSFRIGGPVEVMAFPKNTAELSALLRAAAGLQTAPVILGAGTNVLAPDAGMKGLCSCLKDAMDGLKRIPTQGPPTGDITNVTMLMALAAVSVVGAGALVILKRRYAR